MEFGKSSAKSKVHSNTSLLQETRITSNKQPIHTLKATRKKNNPKVSRRKEIIKTRADINEKEIKETFKKINRTKNLFLEKVNKVDRLFSRLIKKKGEESHQ